MQQQRVIATRRWGRTETRMFARVFAMTSFMKFGPDINCRIVNLSEGGALLEFPNGEEIPDDFYLVLDALPERRIVCTVVHRLKNRVGVSFSILLPAAIVKELGKTRRLKESDKL